LLDEFLKELIKLKKFNMEDYPLGKKTGTFFIDDYSNINLFEVKFEE
jgi:hypothetical protein